MCEKDKKASMGDDNMNTVIERPCTPLKSMEKSLKEVKSFLKDEKKLKNIDDSMKMWEQWANQDDEE